jgi:fluoroquinolone transport system permease protein
MLSWMIFVPLVIILTVRIVVPILTEQLQLQFDLRPYYVLVNSLMYMTMPMLVGMVIGFLLLDQRDDQTLTALQVTPLSLNGYLAYRISLPILIAFIITVALVPLTGLVPTPLAAHLVTALSAAPLAPIFALFYAAFAQNKVQGFAVMKASGIVMLPPMAAYFLPAAWQVLAAFIPTFWPVKVYWLLLAGNPLGWLALVLGTAYQFLLIAVLVRWFNKVMHAT